MMDLPRLLQRAKDLRETGTEVKVMPFKGDWMISTAILMEGAAAEIQYLHDFIRQHGLEYASPSTPSQKQPQVSEAAHLRIALNNLSNAVAALGRFKDGKTLFDGSPSQDPECYAAWKALNDAQFLALGALAGVTEIVEVPDTALRQAGKGEGNG